MQTKKTFSRFHFIMLVFSLSLAIFAMFFGAGNLVFPLSVGTNAGHNLSAGILGFLATGIFIPFLGLYAVLLYEGHYMTFLKPIGEKPALVMASILIVIIGFFVGTPRCGIIAFQSLTLLIHDSDWAGPFFNAVFLSLIFLASIRQKKIVDILGYILSPIKLTVLLVLVIVAYFITPHPMHLGLPFSHTLVESARLGYGTMDLFGALFYCTFVCKAVKFKTAGLSVTKHQSKRIALWSCVCGACIMGVVYLIFIVVANNQAAKLHGLPTASLIGAIAVAVFGNFGSYFVTVCVSLACFSTALVLTAMTVDFFRERIFKKRVSYLPILIGVLLIDFVMSNLGFDTIMHYATPVLAVLYPPLLVLTVMNIVSYYKPGKQIPSWVFYISLIISFITVMMG